MKEFKVNIRNFDGHIVVRAKSAAEAKTKIKRMFKKAIRMDVDKDGAIQGVTVRTKVQIEHR